MFELILNCAKSASAIQKARLNHFPFDNSTGTTKMDFSPRTSWDNNRDFNALSMSEEAASSGDSLAGIKLTFDDTGNNKSFQFKYSGKTMISQL